MGRVTSFLGSLPLVPSKWGKGSEWAAEALEELRGDADAVGFIRGNDGWELIPGNLEIESDEQWFAPTDGSRRYPADGIPSNPKPILGVPAVVGYKDFGSLNEIPSVGIAADETVVEIDADPQPTRDELREQRQRYILANNSLPLSNDEDDKDEDDEQELYHYQWPMEELDHRDGEWVQADDLLDDEFVPSSGWFGGETRCWVVKKETDGVEHREVTFEEPGPDEEVVAELVKPEIIDDGPTLRERVGAWIWDKKQSRAWPWMQGDADTLLLEQDDDASWALERADFETGEGPDWFRGRQSDYPYDARGKGGSPDGFENGTSLGLCYSDIPSLLAPALCRIARNIHEGRTEVDQTGAIGGNVEEISLPSADDLFPEGPGGSQADTPAIADGGRVPELAVKTNRGDIFVEERALVMPEDIKLLGGNKLTQDVIQTLVDQMEAKENPPGSFLTDNLPEYAMVMISFIMGAMLVGDADVAGSVGEAIPMVLGLGVI